MKRPLVNISLVKSLATDTFTVNGVDFVAGTDFTVDGILEVSVQNLTTAINTSADIAIIGILIAINNFPAENSITIEAVAAGTAGNAITIAFSGPSSAFNNVSGPTLEGGLDARDFY